MLVSKPKSLYSQSFLFDEPLRGHGHVRNVCGNLAERLTCRLIGGVRHRTTAGCYCPDISAGGKYYESKAVGRSATAFVYAGRLEKDYRFTESRQLQYVIWHHGADIKSVATVSQLERLVLSTLRAAYVVPFVEVYQLCAKMKPSKLNSKYGGSDKRPEYGSGYRMRLSQFAEWETHWWHETSRSIADELSCSVNG